MGQHWAYIIVRASFIHSPSSLPLHKGKLFFSMFPRGSFFSRSPATSSRQVKRRNCFNIYSLLNIKCRKCFVALNKKWMHSLRIYGEMNVWMWMDGSEHHHRCRSRDSVLKSMSSPPLDASIFTLFFSTRMQWGVRRCRQRGAGYLKIRRSSWQCHMHIYTLGFSHPTHLSNEYEVYTRD